ncbi:MAG TPA: hypothetical protein PL181_15855 [bacterium]|nr:hypothetical protein [bacterium]
MPLRNSEIEAIKLPQFVQSKFSVYFTYFPQQMQALIVQRILPPAHQLAALLAQTAAENCGCSRLNRILPPAPQRKSLIFTRLRANFYYRPHAMPVHGA